MVHTRQDSVVYFDETSPIEQSQREVLHHHSRREDSPTYLVELPEVERDAPRPLSQPSPRPRKSTIINTWSMPEASDEEQEPLEQYVRRNLPSFRRSMTPLDLQQATLTSQTQWGAREGEEVVDPATAEELDRAFIEGKKEKSIDRACLDDEILVDGDPVQEETLERPCPIVQPSEIKTDKVKDGNSQECFQNSKTKKPKDIKRIPKKQKRTEFENEVVVMPALEPVTVEQQSPFTKEKKQKTKKADIQKNQQKSTPSRLKLALLIEPVEDEPNEEEYGKNNQRAKKCKRPRSTKQRDKSQSPSLRDKSQRPSSQDKSRRPSSQDKPRRLSSQDKSQRLASQDKSRRLSSQGKSRRPSSQDKSRRPSSQDKSRRPSFRRRSQRSSLRQSGSGEEESIWTSPKNTSDERDHKADTPRSRSRKAKDGPKRRRSLEGKRRVRGFRDSSGRSYERTRRHSSRSSSAGASGGGYASKPKPANRHRKKAKHRSPDRSDTDRSPYQRSSSESDDESPRGSPRPQRKPDSLPDYRRNGKPLGTNHEYTVYAMAEDKSVKKGGKEPGKAASKKRADERGRDDSRKKNPPGGGGGGGHSADPGRKGGGGGGQFMTVKAPRSATKMVAKRRYHIQIPEHGRPETWFHVRFNMNDENNVDMNYDGPVKITNYYSSNNYF